MAETGKMIDNELDFTPELIEKTKATLNKILEGTVSGSVTMPSKLRGEIYKLLDDLTDLLEKPI